MNTLYYNADALGMGGSLDGGSGGHNTLVMAAGDAAGLSAAPAAVKDFQTLDIGVTEGANPVVVNLNNIGNINHVVSDGTTGNNAAPSAQVETFLAPALAAGQSVTIDGVTVTAVGAATADQVAHAIVAQQSVPGVLVESGAYADPNFTVTQGTNIDNVVFSYNAGNGYQAPISVSTAGVGAAVAPTEAETTTPVAAATDTWSVTFGESFAVGETYTLDGETVTVLNATATASDIVNAFVSGATAGGKLAVAGPLNTSEWTLAANGSSVTLTSTTANSSVPAFTASNTLPFDANGNISANGGAPAPTLTHVTTGAAAVNEVETLTFSSLAIGQSITVNGQTITAISALTAEQVAAVAAGGVSTSGATVTGTAAAAWSVGEASGNTVAYTYNVDTSDGHKVAIGAASGAVAAPVLAGTVGSPVPGDAAVLDNLTYTGGNGSAPLTLNGYTSGGTLEFTSDAVINAPVTVGLTGTATGGNVFNVNLDGGVSSAAVVSLANVATLDVTLSGSGTNNFNLSETALTKLVINDAAHTSGGVVISDTTAADHAGLVSIDAHLTTAGTTDDVTGLAGILSETAAITFTGGADHLVAQSADAMAGTTGLETITSGTGGVTFTANAEALGGAGNTQSYNFDLTMTNHAKASDTLIFADGSALDSAPAVVKGFTTDSLTGFNAGHVDAIGFTIGGDTVLADNSIVTNVTGAAGLNETSLHGIITFGGVAAATDSISALLIAAETLVDQAGQGTTAAFVSGGNTYIVHAGAGLNPTSDTVIELAGTTGIMGLETHATGTAHYAVI
jgi:hypothetical protein